MDRRIGKEELRLSRLACIQKVTPRQVKPRVSRTKGHLSKRTAFVRDVVKEVSGYAFSPTTVAWPRAYRTRSHHQDLY